jgi:hypothetical protein
MSSVADVIWQCVEGRLPAAPETIVGFIINLDYFERIGVTLGELNEALGELVTRGIVGELAPGRYIDGRSRLASPVFTAITVADYEAAVASRDWRRPKAERIEDPEELSPGVVLLDATIPIRAGGPTRTDWRAAEDLAERVVQVLVEHGKRTRILALRTLPDRIEFEVFGGANDAASTFHRIALPVFSAFAPAGSWLVPRDWETWGGLPGSRNRG